MPPGGSAALEQTVTSLLSLRVSPPFPLHQMNSGLTNRHQPAQRPSTGDVLASSDFARWVREDMHSVLYVVAALQGACNRIP